MGSKFNVVCERSDHCELYVTHHVHVCLTIAVQERLNNRLYACVIMGLRTT